MVPNHIKAQVAVVLLGWILVIAGVLAATSEQNGHGGSSSSSSGGGAVAHACWAVIAFLAFSIIYTCAALYSEKAALIRGAARLLTMQTTINLVLTLLAYELCAVLGVFQGVPAGDNSVADRHRAGAQCLFAGCIFISFFTLTLMLTLDLACDGDKSLATVSPLMSQIHASQFIEMAPPNVTRGSPPLVMHSGIRTCDMCGCSVRTVDTQYAGPVRCVPCHEAERRGNYPIV